MADIHKRLTKRGVRWDGRIRDGGRTWTTLTEFPVAGVSATEGLDTIVASGPSGAIRSTDAGGTWQAVGLPSAATLA